ncbi:MAG: BspA family leucine-rich repeat surface protein [Firmicutes bacterium]|nr:BspA family leucine-rich repeat surface protein [Bacillota bacterium]
MKKKGFTLAELLSVIVIMGIILLVAIPSVFGISKVVKDNMFCTKVHNLESAAKLYGSDYNDDFDDRGYIKVEVKTIIDNNLYKKETDECSLGDEDNGCVVDPRDESALDNRTITIVKTGQRYYAYYDFDKEEDIVLCEGKKETDKYKHYDVALDNQGATYPGTTIVRDVVFGHEMPKIDVPRKIYTVKLIDKLTNYHKEEKVEYTFRGYFATKNGGVKYYDENGINVHYYNLPDGRPLYAVWTDKSVNIPKRAFTGYVFQGWYNAETDGVLITEGGNYIPTSDITLYARWIPKEVTLTLDSQSATFKGTEKVIARYNEPFDDITIPQKEYNVTLNYNGSGTPNTVLKSNNAFDGYYSQRNGSGTQYYDSTGKGIGVSKFTSNSYIYASWKNGSITLPNASRPGYKFEGWYTAASGGTKVGIAGTKYSSSKNITLYAHWKISDAVLKDGVGFNTTIKTLANPSGGMIYSEYATNDNIKRIVRSSSPAPSGVKTLEVSDPESDNQIYAWFTNGTIYLYSDSPKIYMNPDSSGMFTFLEGITNLDLSMLDSSRTENMKYMFFGMSSLKSLNVSSLDTSNATNMNGMFFNLDQLTRLDVSNFNTSKVTNMSWMFYNLQSITELNLRNFDTSNVTDMSYMFEYVDSVKTLDLRSFNTSKVTDMSWMFWRMTELLSLNVSSFDTSNVKNMSYMFSGTFKLSSLNVKNFNTSNVTNMKSMFDYACALTSLDVSSFDTSNVTNMNRMFAGLIHIKTLDLSNFNTSKVVDMGEMFKENDEMTSVNLSGWDTSNVKIMAGMFNWNCSLQSIDVSHFNTSKVENMAGMFYQCSSLKTIDVSNFDTSNVKSMAGMFARTSTEVLDVSNFNTSKVEDMSGMFAGLGKVTNLNLSNFDTSKVKYMGCMFSQSTRITELDLSSFNTSSLESTGTYYYDTGTGSMNWMSYEGMFSGMTSLRKIYVSDKWNMSKVTYSYQMFTASGNLVGGAGTRYNGSHTDVAYAHIDGAGGPGYLTRK